MGTRYLLGLVPFLANTLHCRHDNSKGPSHRVCAHNTTDKHPSTLPPPPHLPPLSTPPSSTSQPDVMAMYLLAEMVVGVSDWLPWLQAFRNESLIPLLVQMIDDRLKVRGYPCTQCSVMIADFLLHSYKQRSHSLKPYWVCLSLWQPVVQERNPY